MRDVDAREELRLLVRAFRMHLAWQQRAGVYGAPAGDQGERPLRDLLPAGSAASQAGNLPGSTIDRPRARAASHAPGHAPGGPRAGARVLDRQDEPEITIQDLIAIVDDAPARQGPRHAAPAARPPARAGQDSPGPAPAGERVTLAAVRAELGDCQRCKLAATRKNIVFGVGDPTAALMFIGEAPGEQEDLRGEPFVGAAGQLLDRMIEAMGWTRAQVYIANVLKCRPPGNRPPEADEVAACRQFLFRQLEAVRPRIIVTLGRPAAHLVLDTTAAMRDLRGRFQEFMGIRVMPTYHPAYLLRQPERKRETWNDLKQVIAELERLGIQPPHAPKT